jgi:hypothetical protein
VAQADGSAQVVIPVLQDGALTTRSRVGGKKDGIVGKASLGPGMAGSIVIERDRERPASHVGSFKYRLEDMGAGRREDGCVRVGPEGLIADGIDGRFHHDIGSSRLEIADREPCLLLFANGEKKARSLSGGANGGAADFSLETAMGEANMSLLRSSSGERGVDISSRVQLLHQAKRKTSGSD